MGSVEEANAEAVLLCVHILRISQKYEAEGGLGTCVFKDIFEDEQAEQVFEALAGTLKSSKKKGFVSYQGELLLQGPSNAVQISLTDEGKRMAGMDAGGAAAPPAEEEAAAPAPVKEDDDASFCARRPAPVAVEEPAPVAVEEPAPAPVEEPPPAVEEAAPAAEAAAPAAEEAAPAPAEEPAPAAEEPAPAAEEAAPAPAAEEPPPAAAEPVPVEAAPDAPAPGGSKDADGKWKVDTSYVNNRTADPSIRRGEEKVGVTGEDAMAAKALDAKKTEDGKWVVDTGYIDHRTKDTDNLQPRRSATNESIGRDAVASASSTVKKQSDGKWAVDTSYVQHRTSDCSNLQRRMTEKDLSMYSDPKDTKYSHDLLKSAENRPADVDPARKEQYLSDEDFQTLFGATPDEFQKLPKWKQTNLKKAKELF